MTSYSANFMVFAAQLMKRQGADIRRWAQDPNPVIAKEFKDVIAAAEEQ